MLKKIQERYFFFSLNIFLKKNLYWLVSNFQKFRRYVPLILKILLINKIQKIHYLIILMA